MKKILAFCSSLLIMGTCFFASCEKPAPEPDGPATGVTPTVGAMPGLKAFVAAVFGGIGSIPGAVIGAFIIGICANIMKGLGWTTFSDAFTFVLLIIVLMFMPTGIFGEKKTDKV